MSDDFCFSFGLKSPLNAKKNVKNIIMNAVLMLSGHGKGISDYIFFQI